MLMRQLMTLFSRSLRKKMLDRVKDDRDAFIDVGSMILHMDTMPQVSTFFLVFFLFSQYLTRIVIPTNPNCSWQAHSPKAV